jgi:hypothetical protein
MSGIVAFDAKDFSRGKYIEEPHPSIQGQKIKKFWLFSIFRYRNLPISSR